MIKLENCYDNLHPRIGYSIGDERSIAFLVIFWSVNPNNLMYRVFRYD